MSGALLLLPVVVVVFLCPLSNGFVVGSWLVRVSTDTPNNNVLTTDLLNEGNFIICPALLWYSIICPLLV
jgi:hypothetical protein